MYMRYRTSLIRVCSGTDCCNIKFSQCAVYLRQRTTLFRVLNTAMCIAPLYSAISGHGQFIQAYKLVYIFSLLMWT